MRYQNLDVMALASTEYVHNWTMGVQLSPSRLISRTDLLRVGLLQVHSRKSVEPENCGIAKWQGRGLIRLHRESESRFRNYASMVMNVQAERHLIGVVQTIDQLVRSLLTQK